MKMIESRLFFNLTKLKYIHFQNHQKYFSVSSKLYSFYEKDSRGAEYPAFIDKPWQEVVKESGKAFIHESKLLWEEIKEAIHQDRKLYADGDTDVFFRFDSEDCLKNWRIGSDKLHKEGNSECSLVINDKKKAVFSGTIDLALPKDGRIKYAGYCSVKSIKKKKSFFRDDYYAFQPFTHLEMRVKGDGRSYAINLGVGMYFDVSWFDTYTFTLFTHGGPYWQVARIPFSKFFLTSKGRIQDSQCSVPRTRINSIGITCAGVAGPFKLEIDYIGCHIDWRHKEEFAYEMYNIPKAFVSS